MKSTAFVVVFLLLFVPQGGWAKKVVKNCPETLRLDAIPQRQSDAISGSEFAKRTSGMSGEDRQSAALDRKSGGETYPHFCGP